MICCLDELASPGSQVFDIGAATQVFVVRREHEVFGYWNSCPHTRAPLDWVPGRFLNGDQTLIQCSMHDALFNIDDGICVAGPCPGQRLSPAPVKIVNGEVVLVADTPPQAAELVWPE